MIPKKIHYCWLSGEKMPDGIKKCMETWKQVMPDYEFILWDKNKFDINSLSFIAEAYKIKRWAFASDYIRLYALYTEGGIYLDTDVIVKKKFDDFLGYDFFSGIEWHYGILRETYARRLLYREKVPDIIHDTPWIGMQAAIMGSIAGHPFLKDSLDWFKDNEHKIKPANIKTKTLVFEALAPEIYATLALKYGFQYRNIEQKISHSMVIFPSSVFAGDIHQASNSCYAIHCCTSEWRKDRSLYAKLSRNTVLRKILRKQPIKEADFFDMYQKFSCLFE